MTKEEGQAVLEGEFGMTAHSPEVWGSPYIGISIGEMAISIHYTTPGGKMASKVEQLKTLSVAAFRALVFEAFMQRSGE